MGTKTRGPTGNCRPFLFMWGWSSVDAFRNNHTPDRRGNHLVMSLNRQLVFDTVAEHLLRQNRKSVNAAGGQCRYLSDDGCMCAIGMLLTKHPREIEGLSVESPRVRNLMDPKYGVSHSYDDVGFLGELQSIHDCLPVARWKHALGSFAVKYSLNPVWASRVNPEVERAVREISELPEPKKYTENFTETFTHKLPNGAQLAINIEMVGDEIVSVLDAYSGTEWQRWDKMAPFLPPPTMRAASPVDPRDWVDKEGRRHTADNFGRHWKFTEDVELVIQYRLGLSEQSIARQHGRHPDAIVRRLLVLAAGFPLGPGRHLVYVRGSMFQLDFDSEEDLILRGRKMLFDPRFRMTTRLTGKIESLMEEPAPIKSLRRYWYVLKTAIDAVPVAKS